MRPSRDPVYETSLEENTYTTTLLYSAFIGVLLPAFHYILQPAHAAADSLPLRLICTACSAVVAALLLFIPAARRYAHYLQLFQIVVVVCVIDMLVVDSNDNHLYIASALLVIIGVQNAFFRTSLMALTMSIAFLFLAAYSVAHGIFWAPYNLTTLAIFFSGYALAFGPAQMHISARQSDIRSRLQAMRATAELEEAHAIAHLGKWSQNVVTGEVQCSQELLRIFGVPPETSNGELGEIYDRSVHPDDRNLVQTAFARCDTDGSFTVDHRIVLPDGKTRWVQLSGMQETDESGAPLHRLGTVIDITARKEAEISLERLARYDPLTGLPNRSMLNDQLRAALKEHRTSQQRCAVLFLDLDRFKDINDTLGHSVGDLLLKEVGGRIRSLLPAGALVARWGGDEFIAVLQNVHDREEIEYTCRCLVQGLSTPFAVDSYEFAVMASIGAALFPLDGDNAEVLIRNADTAMYAAKDSPGERYAFFEMEMHAIAAMRHRIQNQLQTAVATNSLALYYQPIVDNSANRIVGAEALLRWIDVDGRIRPPADFISIAEDTGAIVPIGMWVIEEAARQAIRWQRAGMPLKVSINLSPRQLAHPEFADTLAAVIRDTGAPPSLLEVEITESGLVPNAGTMMRVLETIRSLGVSIAVDDFGTGYSAFSYLKQLPLNTLKIDRAFVDGIERDIDRSIAESIIALGHKLHLSVTAEGVETEFQRKILSELGCDRLQGFDICKPLPISDFEHFTRLQFTAR